MEILEKISNLDVDCLDEIKADLIVVPLTEQDLAAKDTKCSNLFFTQLKLTLKRDLTYDLQSQGFTARPLSKYIFSCPYGVQTKAIALIGCESSKVLSTQDSFLRIDFYRKFGAMVANVASEYISQSVAIDCSNLDLGDEYNYLALLEGLYLSSYHFDNYKSKKSDDFLKELYFVTQQEQDDVLIDQAFNFSKKTCFARDLVNMPASDCTPRYLAETCKRIAKDGGLKFKLYDSKALKEMEAEGILTVGKGSVREPLLVKLSYEAENAGKRVALLGKGVTFDSGGLSLKRGEQMALMKCDMAGAAVLIAVMQGIAELQPDVTVNAYIPLVENAVSAYSMHPGDIVKTMSGKTVEIADADCEGRLILADAITLASRDEPDIMIDVATLTYSSMVSLGTLIAPIFSNDEELVSDILGAGVAEGESFWQMPLYDDYRENNASTIADLINKPASYCGAINAALFLQEFVPEDVLWAHLDITGTAYAKKNRFYLTQGATGFSVRTLLRYIMELSATEEE